MEMGIEAVASAAAMQGPLGAAPGARAAYAVQGGGAGDVFANLIRRELGELNASVGTAEIAMRDLAAGKPVELHEVMISLEHARLSVQTFVQVRNKLVESYQDLMRMQL